MAYIIARTVPKYTITKRNTVNIRNLTDEQKRAVFLDLNKKGYFVARDRNNALSGQGVFNKGFYNYDFKLNEAHNHLLMINKEVYCLKLDAERLKNMRANCIKFIGEFAHYNVSMSNDTVHVGCQKFSKDRAIKMAKLIIKGRTQGQPFKIGQTESGIAVHLSQNWVSGFGANETSENAVKLANAVLKAYKVKA